MHTPHTMQKAIELARARVKPRWGAAFLRPRWCYHQGQALVPFTLEQSTAIESGATNVQLGGIQATVNSMRTMIDIDGNVYPLQQAKVPPQPITISDDHDSSHMDVRTILDELEVLTGVSTCRWMIDIDEGGHIEVHVAPSDAYVAPEIRQRAVTDHASLAQWLAKYNVKATLPMLQTVFGATASFLPPDAATGTDSSALEPFIAPLTVHLHSKDMRVRRLSVLGVSTLRDVLVAAGKPLYLHGVPLLPFNDIPIWRCCYYNNNEIHLYDHVHPVRTVHVPTLAGLLTVPCVRAPRAFVPYPTVSGNMFGDRAVHRPLDVARCMPKTLTRQWLVALNASSDFASLDHGKLLLEVLAPHFGRDPVLAVLQTMMDKEQHHALKAEQKLKQHTCLRRRFVTYVRTIMDVAHGTQTCPTLDVVFQGRSFAVTPAMRWSQLTHAMPAGLTLQLEEPVSAAGRALMASGDDFLLEELRTNTVKVAAT